VAEFGLTVVAALVGAFSGGWAQHWWTQRAELKKRRETLVQRYLIQHQDAVEALWFRLHNLANQGGRAVMTDHYFEVTTMYALGRVLAIERIMALDGVHPQLDAIDSGLAEYLRQ
jgi:hypothetical protein